MQFSLMVANFTRETPNDEQMDWWARTYHELKKNPGISEVFRWKKSDTPIPMLRNKCVRQALENKIDYILMLDSDIEPDPVGKNGRPAFPNAKPFVETSLAFFANVLHHQPGIVAAPYCGPPPHENVFIFQWTQRQTDNPDDQFQLSQFSREEAANRCGIEQVAALPTGLMLMRTSLFKELPRPWFYYEYTDEYESDKASTEDVTFTRDVTMHGTPIFVNWDSWAVHQKLKRVGKPSKITVDQVREKFVSAVRRGHDRRRPTCVLPAPQFADATTRRNATAAKAAKKKLEAQYRLNNHASRALGENGKASRQLADDEVPSILRSSVAAGH